MMRRLLEGVLFKARLLLEEIWYFIYLIFSDGNNVEDEVADFTPKEVIDVEKALLDNEREERSRSALFKVTSYVLYRCIAVLLTIFMITGVIVVIIHYVLHT